MKKILKNKLLSFILSISLLGCLLVPANAFAGTASVPMYLTVVSNEPVMDFSVTETINMSATAGQEDLSIDNVTVTNTGGVDISVSEITIAPETGWAVAPYDSDFSVASAKSLGFKCGNFDFYNAEAYSPKDKIVASETKSGTATYIISGKISKKAQVTSSTKVATMVVTVEKALDIVSWADGTDAQIVAMVAAADRGEINLSDYWAVGDTRTVHLSAMAATGVGESHAEQDVELVLMHAGEYKLNSAVESGRDTCSFVVGMKDCLNETGYMNSTDTNSGSWEGSARRTWCNSVFKGAIPSSLLPIFKQFNTITAETYNGTTLKTSVDWFALAAEREIFGAGYGYSDNGWANNTEAASTDIFQFTWYQTSANRIKKLGTTGSAGDWWERSPGYYGSDYFCRVYYDGGANRGSAGSACGLAPFGCI